MMSKSIRLTQAAVDKIKPPKTGRLEVRDLVFPGMRLRISDTGLKFYSLITRYRGYQSSLPCVRHRSRTLSDARDKARLAMEDV